MRLKQTSRWILVALLYCLVSSGIFAQTIPPATYEPIREYTNQAVWDLPGVPESQLDIGLWALIIAKEFDPRVDVQYNLNLLDSMATEITRMLAGRNLDIEKTSMTRTFLYESGPWNDHRPFTYDLDDPLGTRLENQLLPSYLASRRGNCLSMPVLFIALMERVDPNVPLQAVRAPLHLFCRLHDRQTGDVWNIETTNGGHPARNQWYIQTLNIPRKAIDSGLYLKSLSKKELLADLMQPLISKYRHAKDFQAAMKYTDLTLQVNPVSNVGLVSKGALNAWFGHNIVAKAKTEQRPLTASEKNRAAYFESESRKYIDLAMAQGWQPETGEQQEEYLSTIRKQKAKEQSASK